MTTKNPKTIKWSEYPRLVVDDGVFGEFAIFNDTKAVRDEVLRNDRNAAKHFGWIRAYGDRDRSDFHGGRRLPVKYLMPVESKCFDLAVETLSLNDVPDCLRPEPLPNIAGRYCAYLVFTYTLGEAWHLIRTTEWGAYHTAGFRQATKIPAPWLTGAPPAEE